MRKHVRLTMSSLVVGLSLVVGGCGFDGGPIITQNIGTTVDDSTDLSVSVKRALKKTPQTALSNIYVTKVSSDSVKLSGYVTDDATLYEAERVAGQVEGVRFVVNSLIVQ